MPSGGIVALPAIKTDPPTPCPPRGRGPAPSPCAGDGAARGIAGALLYCRLCAVPRKFRRGRKQPRDRLRRAEGANALSGWQRSLSNLTTLLRRAGRAERSEALEQDKSIEASELGAVSGANLYLRVPEQSAQASPTAKTDPEDVETWLARLPLLDPEESLKQLYVGMHALNRVRMKPANRLRLVEMYHAPVSQVREEAEKRVAAASFPLPKRIAEFTERLATTELELAYAYKIVVMDYAGQGFRLQHGTLASAIYRAITSLAAAYYAAALGYKTLEQNVWQELHHLYVYARSQGIENRELVKLAPGTRAPLPTIETAYKSALLLGLADPGRLSPQLTIKASAYLARWAQLASITSADEVTKGRCRFVVDSGRDQPAIPAEVAPHRSKDSTRYLLNTAVITRLAYTQWKQMQRGRRPARSEDDEAFYDQVLSQLLPELVRAWGIAPRRRHARRRREGEMDVHAGLDQVWLLFGGNDIDGAGDGDVDEIVVLSANRTQVRAKDELRLRPPIRCGLVDESPDGCLLRADSAGEGRFRVGDVIGMREVGQGDHPWQLALIRRMRMDENDGVLLIGVQRLAGKPHPVLLRPSSVESADDEREACGLLQVPRESTGDSRQLVCAAGLFVPGATAWLRDTRGDERLELARMLDTSRYVQRFALRPAPSRAEADAQGGDAGGRGDAEARAEEATQAGEQS